PARVRSRQGRLRGGLRGAQPAGLAAHPTGLAGPPSHRRRITMTTTIAREELDRLVGGAHHNPHAVLGAHPLSRNASVVRTLRPEASAVAVVAGHNRIAMHKVHDGGVFEAVLDAPPDDYRL